MIHARIENGEVIPLTDEDRRELSEMFPDGNVALNSNNCPEVAAAIEKISANVLVERKNLYRRLANAQPATSVFKGGTVTIRNNKCET